MRLTSFVLSGVLSGAVFLGAGSMATAGPLLDTLRKIEVSGLKSIPEKRMKTFFDAKSAAGDLEMSRDWIDRLPVAAGDTHWRCLSEALYFEARGETVEGMFAVAEVIMNRVESARFPDSICGVVKQGTGKRYQCQFTYTCDGHAETIHEPRAYQRVAKIARLALDGEAPELTSGATHYHTTAVRPRWSRTYTRTARIGEHLFYRHTYRTAKQ